MTCNRAQKFDLKTATLLTVMLLAGSTAYGDFVSSRYGCIPQAQTTQGWGESGAGPFVKTKRSNYKYSIPFFVHLEQGYPKLMDPKNENYPIDCVRLMNHTGLESIVCQRSLDRLEATDGKELSRYQGTPAMFVMEEREGEFATFTYVGRRLGGTNSFDSEWSTIMFAGTCVRAPG
jgi:hypothetical protein